MRRLPAWAATLAGLCFIGVAQAAETGRYQAVPLEGDSNTRGGHRVFIIDTQDGHVWTWSGNELVSNGSNARRYGPAFVYHGKLRPGSRTGEVIEPFAK